jgi:O-antigen/teichoic acid export membrane protein
LKYSINDIKGNPLLLNTLKLSSSNIIMYLLPFIVTPILSRIYPTTAFGEWGIFSSFVSIVTVGIFWGLENMIIKTNASEELSGGTLCLATGTCTTALIALVFMIGNLFTFSFFTGFPSKILLFVYLIAYILYTIFYNYANKYQKYSGLALNHIIQGGSQALFRVGLGFWGISVVNGLILGTTIAQIISMIFLVALMYPTLVVALKNRKTSVSSMKRLLVKHKNFPLYDAPSSLLSFAAFNLPLLVLSYYFDKSQIGCYSIILQLLLLPMSFIGSSMGRVYYQQICQMNDESEISRKTKNILQLMAIIAILPLLFMACGGDFLLQLYLGSQWHSVKEIALPLSLWAFPTVLTQPLLPLYRQKNKQRTLLRFDLLYFCGGIGSIWLGCLLSDKLYYILICYSVICLLVKLALFFNILKLSKISLSRFIKIYPLWLLAIAILTIRLCQ